ncbi:hypothetical protein ABNIH17_15068, partial [Acinetobacter baumannii ABNIH17]
ENAFTNSVICSLYIIKVNMPSKSVFPKEYTKEEIRSALYPVADPIIIFFCLTIKLIIKTKETPKLYIY